MGPGICAFLEVNHGLPLDPGKILRRSTTVFDNGPTTDIDPMQLPLTSQHQLPGSSSAGTNVLGKADRGTEDIGFRI